MLKVDKKYCWECGEHTLHNYVGSKSDFEGLGIARIIVAVSSLGFLKLLVEKNIGNVKNVEILEKIKDEC